MSFENFQIFEVNRYSLTVCEETNIANIVWWHEKPNVLRYKPFNLIDFPTHVENFLLMISWYISHCGTYKCLKIRLLCYLNINDRYITSKRFPLKKDLIWSEQLQLYSKSIHGSDNWTLNILFVWHALNFNIMQQL